jgi:peptidoglycan/xylan/chitin deacetylase (PgdA/CDA1 family)
MMTAVGSSRDALALCYHVVSVDATEHPGAIRRDVLERQLARLLAHGYRPARFTEAVLEPPARRILAVTFDDAEVSVLEVAAPLLARLGVPGTVFVPTARVGTHPTMTWDELRALAAAGWEVGAHGHTHAALPPLDDEGLQAELRQPRELLGRELKAPCRSLAYPFGRVDGRVAAAAAAAGYAAAATVAGTFAGATPLTWPRVNVHRDDGDVRFRLKVSPLVRRLRQSPLGRLPTPGARAAPGP